MSNFKKVLFKALIQNITNNLNNLYLAIITKPYMSDADLLAYNNIQLPDVYHALIKIPNKDIYPVVKRYDIGDNIPINGLVLTPDGYVYKVITSTSSGLTEYPGNNLNIKHNYGREFTDDSITWKFCWRLTPELFNHYIKITSDNNFDNTHTSQYMPVSYSLYDEYSIEYKEQVKYGIPPEHILNELNIFSFIISTELQGELNVGTEEYNKIEILDNPLTNGYKYKNNVILNEDIDHEYKGISIYSKEYDGIIKRFPEQRETIKIRIGL
jgi:hypothetical protein